MLNQTTPETNFTTIARELLAPLQRYLERQERVPSIAEDLLLRNSMGVLDYVARREDSLIRPLSHRVL